MMQIKQQKLLEVLMELVVRMHAPTPLLARLSGEAGAIAAEVNHTPFMSERRTDCSGSEGLRHQLRRDSQFTERRSSGGRGGSGD